MGYLIEIYNNGEKVGEETVESSVRAKSLVYDFERKGYQTRVSEYSDTRNTSMYRPPTFKWGV